MRRIALFAASALYVAAGSMHFLKPAPYVRIMPPFLPWPLALVYISGAAEIAGGLGLLPVATRRAAAWGLVALLVAVFPANIHMAIANVQVTAKPIPPILLWARLPLQVFLIWWVLWASKPFGTARSVPAAEPVPPALIDPHRR